jgi:hypothetical protein
MLNQAYCEQETGLNSSNEMLTYGIVGISVGLLVGLIAWETYCWFRPEKKTKPDTENIDAEIKSGCDKNKESFDNPTIDCVSIRGEDTDVTTFSPTRINNTMGDIYTGITNEELICNMINEKRTNVEEYYKSLRSLLEKREEFHTYYNKMFKNISFYKRFNMEHKGEYCEKICRLLLELIIDLDNLKENV